MVAGEAEYLIGRASAQLALARNAKLSEVAAVHLELSSLYLQRALALIDSARTNDRHGNVVFIRR